MNRMRITRQGIPLARAWVTLAWRCVYDHLTNTLCRVKETNLEAIYRMNLNEGAGNALANPFDPASLGLLDLSDIYLLSNSLAFAGTDREWNL